MVVSISPFQHLVVHNLTRKTIKKLLVQTKEKTSSSFKKIECKKLLFLTRNVRFKSMNSCLYTIKKSWRILFKFRDKFLKIICFDQSQDDISFGSHKKLISWFDTKSFTSIGRDDNLSLCIDGHTTINLVF